MDGQTPGVIARAARDPRRKPQAARALALALFAVSFANVGRGDEPNPTISLARRYWSPLTTFQPCETDIVVGRIIVPDIVPDLASDIAPGHILLESAPAPVPARAVTPVPSAAIPAAKSQPTVHAAVARPVVAIPVAPSPTAPSRAVASAGVARAVVARPVVASPAVPIAGLARAGVASAGLASAGIATPVVRFQLAEPTPILTEVAPAAFVVSPGPAPMGMVTMAVGTELPPPPPAPPAESDGQPAVSAPPPTNGQPGPLPPPLTAAQPMAQPVPQSETVPGALDSLSKVEKLGDAPSSNSLEFLRQQAVLLKCGQSQVDWGLTYTVLDSRFALLNANNNTVTLANARERLRLMTIPLAVRYGLTDDFQVFVNAPLGWSNNELTTDVGGNSANNFVGVGDISAGFNYHMMKGCGAYVPDIITTVGFVAPTGHATIATSLLAPASALGQGFWSINTSILAVHTMDPLVLYYGGGYVHRFDTQFGNTDVEPGEEINYLCGVGFAVNPWVTLSGTVIGSYLTRFGVNDISIPGSDLDILRFRVSATIVKDKRICEPFGEIGMTPESPSRVGVVFTY